MKSTRLEKEKWQFAKLLEIQQRIGTEHNLDRLLQLVISEISILLDAERSTVFLIDWDNMELQSRFAEGIKDEDIAIKLRMGIVGWAVLSRKEICIANATDHPYFNPDIDQVHGFKTESILVAPIFDHSGKIAGALELLNKDSGVFNEHDIAFLKKEAKILGEQENFQNLSHDDAEALIIKLTASSSCERGSIFVIDEDHSQLRSIYADGIKQKGIKLHLNLGVAGLIAVTGRSMNIPDTKNDIRFSDAIDLKTGYETRNILGFPIKNHHQEIIGVIEVINKKAGSFTDDDVKIMHGLSSIVAIAVENAQIIEEDEQQFRSIVEVMAASIDAKDKMTAGHSARVTEYAVGIGRELGFSEPDLEVISVAGLLHDYGKLGIADHVLKKPGRLTSQEYSHIKEHVVLTRSILSKMRFSRKYRNVPSIAAAHHEYLDGSGYDSGLTGKEIPFMAKIITVADVFEALTSDRHYRTALSYEKALAKIEKEAGIKYDEKVIKGLKDYLKRNKADNH